MSAKCWFVKTGLEPVQKKKKKILIRSQIKNNGFQKSVTKQGFLCVTKPVSVPGFNSLINYAV